MNIDDDWDDESFLVAAITATDAASAASASIPNPNPPSSSFITPQPNPNPYHFPFQRPQQQQPIPFSPPVSSSLRHRDDVSISHSPPRELSQRVPQPAESVDDSGITVSSAPYRVGVSGIPVPSAPAPRSGGGRGGGGKSRGESEVEKLKRELDRVSKKLKSKEREYEELQKEKATMDERLKNGQLQTDRDAEIYKLKSTNIACGQAAGQSAVPDLRNYNIVNGLASSSGLMVQHVSRSKHSKTIGVQTHTVQDGCFSHGIVSREYDILSKLRAIWSFPGENMVGRNLISDLFETCSEDLGVLFKYTSISSTTNLNSCSNGKFSDLALEAIQSPADQVSGLYVILMKMRHEAVPLQSLLEALFELCTLENVVVVHKSLRILHSLLQHLSCSRRLDRRNNVLINHSHNNKFQRDSRDELEQQNKSEISSTQSFGWENLDRNQDMVSRTTLDLSSDMLIAILEKMQQIAFRNNEEYILTEAVSIMNLLLMTSNLSDLEKFDLATLLEGLPQLLQKKVGVYVQNQAVRLLFLLLNCQNMLMKFFDWQRDDSGHAKAVNSLLVRPTLGEEANCILLSLGECLACAGASSQVLKLQRNVITILAFIASSGNSGFDVLLHSATPQEENFLELIIRLLASEIDAGKADDTNTKSQDHRDERRLLVREGLILLNRLASNPAYSKATLGVLTSGSTARSTIDVANRMSKKSRSHWQHDDTQMRQMEAEIVDLGQLFKARVCAFLGENNT